MAFETETVHDHCFPVTALAFSPDGRAIATGDSERQVCVRQSGGIVRRWSFQTVCSKVRAVGRMRTLAFSPQGDYLFVSARDAIDALWTDSGCEAWHYRPPRYWGFLVTSPLRLAVSKRGMLAASFDNGTVGVWSCSGSRHRIWQDQESPTWVGWAQNDEYLVGADSYHVQTWEWRSRTRVERWTPGEKIFSFSVHPSEDTAAVRTLHEIQIIDLKDGRILARFPAPIGLPLIAFRPASLELAVCGIGFAMVYSFGGEERARFRLDGRRPTALAWAADGSILAIGCADGSVSFFDMKGAGTELSEILRPAPSA